MVHVIPNEAGVYMYIWLFCLSSNMVEMAKKFIVGVIISCLLACTVSVLFFVGIIYQSILSRYNLQHTGISHTNFSFIAVYIEFSTCTSPSHTCTHISVM